MEWKRRTWRLLMEFLQSFYQPIFQIQVYVRRSARSDNHSQAPNQTKQSSSTPSSLEGFSWRSMDSQAGTKRCQRCACRHCRWTSTQKVGLIFCSRTENRRHITVSHSFPSIYCGGKTGIVSHYLYGQAHRLFSRGSTTLNYGCNQSI